MKKPRCEWCGQDDTAEYPVWGHKEDGVNYFVSHQTRGYCIMAALARAERAEAEAAKLRAERDAAREMLRQTTDGLDAYRQVAERVGALNVLPGASWDTPDPKPVGRVEVLVLREAVWCDDVEEWEDTQTDKCLRTVVAWRPGRAAPGDGGEEAG